jgi:hypothetical protein
MAAKQTIHYYLYYEFFEVAAVTIFNTEIIDSGTGQYGKTVTLGNECWNRNVFSRKRKTGREDTSCTSKGR